MTVFSAGSCGLAGFTECCNTSIESDCFGATGTCFCDESCYEFGNCCDDIEDVGCLGQCDHHACTRINILLICYFQLLLQPPLSVKVRVCTCVHVRHVYNYVCIYVHVYMCMYIYTYGIVIIVQVLVVNKISMVVAVMMFTLAVLGLMVSVTVIKHVIHLVIAVLIFRT